MSLSPVIPHAGKWFSIHICAMVEKNTLHQIIWFYLSILRPRRNLMLHLCHSFNELEETRKRDTGAEKNDVMDIERAAVGEMRPSHRAIPVQSHTHTEYCPSQTPTHTHAVSCVGVGRPFEVSLQLWGLTPQVSPWLFTQSLCNSVGKRPFQRHYKAGLNSGGISVLSCLFCFWPVCDRVRLRLKAVPLPPANAPITSVVDWCTYDASTRHHPSENTKQDI